MPKQKFTPDILIGQRFSRLLVIKKAPSKGKNSHWQCRCDCGSTTVVSRPNLRVGHTRSCGCIGTEQPSHLIHGMHGKPEYQAWNSMHTRCTNPKNKGYHRYGGRGITVCERWLKFENFLADMGMRPSPDHSLERKDNDGPYAPDNCKWATRKEQARNTRQNVWLTFNNQTLILHDWAVITGIDRSLIRWRQRQGWPIKRVLGF